MRKKIFLFVPILLFAAACLASCSADKTPPEYLIECARDNGFVPSYRAYVAIGEGGVEKISKSKFERYRKNNDYKIVPEKYYSFEAHGGPDPSTWNYTQSKYDESVYDVEVLQNYLKAMKLNFLINTAAFGDPRADIAITEFDGFSIIEVNNINEFNTIIDSRYAVFYNGELLSMPDNLEIGSIRTIYKNSKD